MDWFFTIIGCISKRLNICSTMLITVIWHIKCNIKKNEEMHSAIDKCALKGSSDFSCCSFIS